MYQAFGQIETTMCMPHRIGSFDWKAFREELRAVRHDVMRRRAALIVNVAPSLVTLGDHPQIVLDGKDIALKYDAAVYLKALIDCGDWMSDPEFKAKLGSENDRPDRWRKQLPPEVRARIETDIRKGSRWRLA